MTLRSVRDALLTARSAIALTGAGVSVESGIPDFRSPGGLWDRYPPDQYATLEAFQRDPERTWQFFFALARLCEPVRPNPAHQALARLEQLGLLQAVITQNIDGLHQQAGSRTVLELHGAAHTVACLACQARRREPIATLTRPPTCHRCGAIMKPDVVLFGELLPEHTLAGAQDLARTCDVCLVVGTSAVVYPAAAIPELAAARGATLCQFDLEPTGLTHTGRIHHFVPGPAGETLPRLVSLIEAELPSGTP